MIQPQLAPAARRTIRALPLGGMVDLLGFVLVGAVVFQRLPFPEAKTFVLTLLSSSVLVWLAIDQTRTSWDTFFRRGYRRLFVPAAASVLTLVISASLRDYYSGSALLAFTVGWTLWIGLGRFMIRRYSPRMRVLWIGTYPEGWRPSDYRGLDVQVATHPPEDWKDWDSIVAADRAFGSAEWRSWLLHAELADTEILSEHKAYEVLTGRVPLRAMREELIPIALQRGDAYARVQRAFDLLVVFVLSPVVLLLCAVVALVVRLDAGRPVLFRQWRVGRDGKTFRIFKFRTMRKDAEAHGPSFARDGDSRTTKVGGFLRKYRLDELPQFWNVLRGEMSVIGPRPEQVPFVTEFEEAIPLYRYRHLVRPGITGWAQVSQGYAAGTDETRDKLSYDLYYVKHQTLLLDAIIVVRTIQTIASGFGAR